MLRFIRLYVVLLLPMMAGACAAPMQGARTLGNVAASGAFACATRAAADFGYTSVTESDGTAVLTKPKRAPAGREVVTRVMSLGTDGASDGHEDRFIVSKSDRYLRIDVVAVLASGTDTSPSAGGLRDAANILDACSGASKRLASAD